MQAPTVQSHQNFGEILLVNVFFCGQTEPTEQHAPQSAKGKTVVAAFFAVVMPRGLEVSAVNPVNQLRSQALTCSRNRSQTSTRPC